MTSTNHAFPARFGQPAHAVNHLVPALADVTLACPLYHDRPDTQEVGADGVRGFLKHLALVRDVTPASSTGAGLWLRSVLA